MAKFDLNQYARRGAEIRIAELQQELESIYSAFPDLRGGRPGQRGRRPGRASAGDTGTATVTASPRRRRRPTMSAAQRRAVSVRMRKYWAERRKAKEKEK